MYLIVFLPFYVESLAGKLRVPEAPLDLFESDVELYFDALSLQKRHYLCLWLPKAVSSSVSVRKGARRRAREEKNKQKAALFLVQFK